MKILGIVAEFNPFHNGHKYLIEKAKEISGADYCIIAMSGDFVQRGEPALIDKYARAYNALKCGADMVLEIPVLSATASAEGFAFGSISLLHNLNSVNYISFGVEHTDISILKKIADILINEPEELKENITALCEQGLSYPLARSKALTSYMSDHNQKSISDIISSPNSILGIEYIKSIKRLNSDINLVPIKRIGADYNDCESFNNLSSASGIRNFLKNNKDISLCVPDESHDIIKLYNDNHGFIFEEDVFSPLLYKLMSVEKDKLVSYIDSNEFIANKISNNIYNFSSYNEMLKILSTKDYTLSRIKRVLTHILLELDDSYLLNRNFSDYTSGYTKVLACNNNELLSYVCKNSSIPVIIKPSVQMSFLNEKALKSFNADLRASKIYKALQTSKYNTKSKNEFQQNIFPDKTTG